MESLLIARNKSVLNKGKSESITSKNKQLKIWFTNCDVFNTLKQQELCSRVATNSPDIICLLEVNQRILVVHYVLQNIKLMDTLLEQNNILLDSGRGMLLYIKKKHSLPEIRYFFNCKRYSI